MKTEDKNLLLLDLCCRLPYEIKCKIEMWKGCDVCTIFNIDSIGYVEIVEDFDTNGVNIERIKPYLFPLSSMTFEQECKYREVIASTFNHYEVYDWLNKNHFDYRGLIEKGLAIDATKLNIY